MEKSESAWESNPSFTRLSGPFMYLKWFRFHGAAQIFFRYTMLNDGYCDKYPFLQFL